MNYNTSTTKCLKGVHHLHCCLMLIIYKIPIIESAFGFWRKNKSISTSNYPSARSKQLRIEQRKNHSLLQPSKNGKHTSATRSMLFSSIMCNAKSFPMEIFSYSFVFEFHNCVHSDHSAEKFNIDLSSLWILANFRFYEHFLQFDFTFKIRAVITKVHDRYVKFEIWVFRYLAFGIWPQSATVHIVRKRIFEKSFEIILRSIILSFKCMCKCVRFL